MLNTFCSNTQHMLHHKPGLDEIDRLLKISIDAGSWIARYYHLLMKVTSIHPFDLDQVLNDFWIFLETRNLRRYWMDIRGIRTSFMFRSPLFAEFWPLLPHLIYFRPRRP